jgi:hypothetical protein
MSEVEKAYSTWRTHWEKTGDPRRTPMLAAAFEAGWDAAAPSRESLIAALRSCHSVMEFFADMTPELEFHNEWRSAMTEARVLLAEITT